MGKEDINLWREKEKSFGLDIKVRFPRLIWVLRCRPEHWDGFGMSYQSRRI